VPLLIVLTDKTIKNLTFTLLQVERVFLRDINNIHRHYENAPACFVMGAAAKHQNMLFPW
jgi:hypothetical protein